MRRISSRVLIGATLVLGVVGIAQNARSQAKPAEVIAPPAVGLQPRPPGGGLDAVRTAPDSFDLLILGGDVESARDRLEWRLIRVIDQVDQMYDLTPEQEKKLELAGRGDIKRFFDRVTEVKKQLDRPEENRVNLGLNARDLQSLRQEFRRDYLDDDSLFTKTLKRMLTPDQRTRYEDRERIASYRTRVNWVLFPLRRELGLSRKQHLQLLELLAKETRPLQKYGELDEDAILLQASRLPDARLKPIFDDDQWRRLKERFDRAKRLENTLVEKGYLARGGN